MRRFALAACLVLLISSPASADRLELTDGTILAGVYAGGQTGVVSFRVDQQGLRAVPVTDIRSLHFEAPPEPSLRVPSRTPVTMRLTQAITHGAGAGSYFKGVLEQALVIDGTIIAPEGTPTLGRISSSKGASGGAATLRLTDLIIGGHRHRVTADPLPLSGKVEAQTILEFRLSSKFHVLESDVGK